MSEARRRQKDRPLIDVDRHNSQRTRRCSSDHARCSQLSPREARASRDRQPSDDVIFVGDDASHERGPMFGFNGAGGGGGGVEIGRSGPDLRQE